MVSKPTERSQDGISKPRVLSSSTTAPREVSSALAASRPHIKALDGLRFFAAFCILFSHSCTWLANFKDNNSISLFGTFFSAFGMPLFFVLSGFVIHYSYSGIFSRRSFSEGAYVFFVARFARLYPLFIVFSVVGFAVDGMLTWLTDHKFNLALTLFHMVTLTQSWVYISIFGDRLILDNGYGLSWSISTEWFFYLWYPLFTCLLLPLSRIKSIVSAIFALSIFLLAALSIAWVYRSNLDLAFRQYLGDYFVDWTHSADRWFFYYSPYSHIFEFILGCLTAHLFLKSRHIIVSPKEYNVAWLILCTTICVLLLLAGAHVSRNPIALTQYLDFIDLNYGMSVPIAVVIFCVSRYDFSPTNILSGWLAVYLGEISYSIYTVHTWTLRIFARPAVEYSNILGVEAVLRIIVAIAITIILASATYRLIEMPARIAIRRGLSAPSVQEAESSNESTFSDRQSDRVARMVYLLLLSAMIAAIAAYQLLIVPHFAHLTK